MEDIKQQRLGNKNRGIPKSAQLAGGQNENLDVNASQYYLRLQKIFMMLSTPSPASAATSAGFTYLFLQIHLEPTSNVYVNRTHLAIQSVSSILSRWVNLCKIYGGGLPLFPEPTSEKPRRWGAEKRR